MQFQNQYSKFYKLYLKCLVYLSVNELVGRGNGFRPNVCRQNDVHFQLKTMLECCPWKWALNLNCQISTSFATYNCLFYLLLGQLVSICNDFRQNICRQNDMYFLSCCLKFHQIKCNFKINTQSYIICTSNALFIYQ